MNTFITESPEPLSADLLTQPLERDEDLRLDLTVSIRKPTWHWSRTRLLVVLCSVLILAVSCGAILWASLTSTEEAPAKPTETPPAANRKKVGQKFRGVRAASSSWQRYACAKARWKD
jgi:hypothetical protein